MDVRRQAEPRHSCASTLSLISLHTLHIILYLLAIILTWHLSFIAQYLTKKKKKKEEAKISKKTPRPIKEPKQNKPIRKSNKMAKNKNLHSEET